MGNYGAFMRPRTRSNVGPRGGRPARYRRSGAGTIINPLDAISWYSAFWADDPQWTTAMPSVAYMGASGLVLPGTSGNYASTPDAAALDITGDITLVARATVSDWTPTTDQTLIAKRQAGGQVSYALRLGSTGVLQIIWSVDGTATLSASATTGVTLVDGSAGWVAVNLDVDDGAGNRVIKFWQSTDGSTWTQVGSTVTVVGTTSIFSSTSIVEIGSFGAGTSQLLTGTLSVARVYSGSAFTTAGPGGSLVFDADFRRANAASFTCDTGQVVTISSGAAVSTWRNGGTLATSGAYLSTSGLTLPGVAGNYASVPDSAALDITGDITLMSKVAMADWTPATSQTIVGKWGSSSTSFLLRLLTGTNQLRFDWVDSGGVSRNVGSTVGVSGFADGAAGWLAVTLDVDDGAGGHAAKFWTSTDGVTWTQLGTTVNAGAFTTSIRDSSAPLTIGAYQDSGATLPTTGTISVARVYSGSGFTAAGPSGTNVLDVDFRVAGNPTSFTASTGQTVTRYSTFSANQSTGASQPTFRSANSVLNNRPVVDFDGTDDRLEITTGVSLAQPFSVVWIGVPDTVGAVRVIVGMESTSTDNGALVSNATPSWRFKMTSAIGSSTPVANAGYMARFFGSGASSAISINGVSGGTGNAGTASIDQIILGAGRTAPSTYANFLDAKTAFLGIYSGDISTHPSWPAFKTWAATHYGITIA